MKKVYGKKKIRIMSFLLVVLVLLSTNLYAVYGTRISDIAVQSEIHNGPIVTIGEVQATAGESVDVPVYISNISNNSGICGMTLKITYDDELTLTNITRGEAMDTLDMTKPGNYKSNPFNILFSGVEEDSTVGLLFTMTFTAPENNGTYNISATYDDGDIVDGNFLPVDVLVEKGSVTVGYSGTDVTINDKEIYLPAMDVASGNIYVAFYDDLDRMTSVEFYDINTEKITLTSGINDSYAKIFCWTSNLAPICEAMEIPLK